MMLPSMQVGAQFEGTGAAMAGGYPQPSLAGNGGGFQQSMDSEGPVAIPTHSNPWPVDETVEEKYEHMEVIGVGVYGTVYKARCRATDRTVAIKKLKIEEDYGQGVPANVIREVVCFRDFSHPNIVEFLDIHITGMQDYSLIFEFVEGDLHKLLKSYRKQDSVLPMDMVKRYAFELLNGVHACHLRMILHRDLKPQNILIGKNGLKIADFGLARMFSLPMRCYTLDVITLWYRAPEILLGTHAYGPEVDLWSAGCIIAEMATGQATFPGDSEIGTIFKIFKTLGTPTEASWPTFRDMKHWKQTFPKWPPTDLQGIYNLRPEMGSEGADLLRQLLPMNPQVRIGGRRAKMHPFVNGHSQEVPVQS